MIRIGNKYKSYLPNFYVEFIMREANAIVHELTQAVTFDSSFCIFNKIVAYISDLIFNEII